VVGENLFVRETGAVAAQFHIPEAIEPYSSTLLATRRGIVLGKKSGVASIKLKCEELGLDAPASAHGRLARGREGAGTAPQAPGVGRRVPHPGACHSA
jgi:isopropylmalate/homocitrate/citramalate synthase